MTQSKEMDKVSQLSAAKQALLDKMLEGKAKTLTQEASLNASPQQLAQTLPQIIPAPDQRYQPFPLNEMQQAYWLGRNNFFEMGNLASHIYFEIESINFDPDRFNQAWQRLIGQHDMLRAVVLPDGQQRVLENPPGYQIEVNDLRSLEPAQADAELAKIRDRLSQVVRPLEVWPQSEIVAARVSDSKTLLFTSIDGWCADGTSIQILFRDLTKLYEDLEVPLPELEFSFRDYVLAGTEMERSELFQRSLDYWQQKVKTLPLAPELPLAINPSALKEPKFKRYQARLSADKWQCLKAMARRKGLTTTGLLLSAYAEVLALWSKSPRFTLNVPRFNRLPLHSQINEVIGEFASFSLLEVDNSISESFEVRAQRLQRQLWQDLDHPYVSGVRVLREMAKFYRSETSKVSFPVVFTTAPQDVVQGTDSAKGADLGELGQIVDALTQTPQVWLDSQHLEEADGSLFFNWDSVEDLFPEGMIEAMFAAYSQLLTQLAQDEDTWQAVGRQHLMPLRQLALREKVNETAKETPEVTLGTLLTDSFQAYSDNVAVIAPDSRLTYRQLAVAAYHLGQQLQQAGIGRNKLVPIVMEKGWEQVVAVLGVLMAGAAYVPIAADTPPERLQYVLANSEASILLTQPHLVSTLEAQVQVPCLCVQSNLLDLAEPDWSNWECSQQLDDLAYVIYTSGTTGAPKGVMLTHRNVVNCIVHINQRWNVSESDRILALSALHYDMSVFDIFGLLAAGGTIVLPKENATKDPAHWSALLRQHQITLWNAVPQVMQMWAEYEENQLDSSPILLRRVMTGGDWIPVSLPGRIKAIVPDIQVLSGGGPTETTIWNIEHLIDGNIAPPWKSIPYGKPVANVRYYILNQSMEDCPDWVAGQMYCAGVQVAKGYWKEPEKTAAKFVTHPRTQERLYATGDSGCYHPDGNIEFLGRVDFQIKIRGHRIEPGEIEAALVRHPGVEAAIVDVASSENERQQLVAYFVPHPDTDAPTKEQLHGFLKEKLPSHMVPNLFAPLESLPLTANGKVNRKQLPSLDAIEQHNSREFIAPSTDLELVIAGIWEDILEVESVGLNDDFFFDLGGHSLLATRVVSSIRETLQVELSLQQIFEYTTVAQQVSIITEDAEERLRVEQTASLLLNLTTISDQDAEELLTTETTLLAMEGKYDG
ncbi:MAG: amino acid adenylation domain-containing protein [Cyanobacteria bacterium P01_F01_bin.150]